jgi:topoisomerase-4 subunit A
LKEINPEVEITEVADTEEPIENEVPQLDETNDPDEVPAIKAEKEKPSVVPVKAAEPAESQPAESVESSSESVESPSESPHKNVDFEITNPDDIEIDDKGQLGLF